MSVVVPTERIRNVLVVGHTGTGKSTLVEALLRTVRSGPPPEGRTTVDHEPEERERGHSLSLATVTFDFDGYRINLLDTPGGAEALGDVYPALAAADTALFVVDATVGLQPQHDELWRLCERQGLPRVVFCNKLDLDRADPVGVLADLRTRYGRPLAAVHLPFHRDGHVGIVDVLHGEAIELIDGERVREPIPDEQAAAAEEAREALVEAVVENDDDLLERYLDGELPDTHEIAEVFAHGIAQGGFFPVLWGSATSGIGVQLLREFLVEECPSPAEAPHELPHDGPTVAAVVKTYADQFVGRINVLRLLSGRLRVDDELVDLRTGATRRLHNLFRLCGREQLPADELTAGDLVAVSKLDDVMTGDVLAADGLQVDVEVPLPPVGFHRVMLQPVAVADDDKLNAALQRLVQEDPSVRIILDPVAGTRVLAFQGPTHVDVSVARLRRRAGVEVQVLPAPIDYRTTIRRPASAVGRHVKQSGGHGQFGIVKLEIAPLPRGEEFRFDDAIVGGVVPGQYIGSVEKGVRAAMLEGPLGGFPVVDVAVRLVDGKHHPVDSSDAAFQMAGILGFRAALVEADPVLLEPIAAVTVVAPEEFTGALMSDLSARRGRILGTDVAGPGRTRVDAHVPEAELTTFAADLRALTSGRGEVEIVPDHHEEVPDNVAKRVLDELATS
ncbi:elongation factor G [Egicoccus sp. AB-alg2]|uniref:elongation factor G n=1 Tax=Egicoccus sp. AB-alg2 TaxID=3242693 RepID=UPI00359CEE1C